MKKIIASAVIISCMFAGSAFASSDMFLQIKGSKSSPQLVKCPNGACSVSALAADSYTVSVVDASGAPVALDSTKVECTVAPRDASSGMATGKRMHKPFTITKELDRAPLVADSPVDLACVSSSAGSVAAPAAVDAPVKAGYDLKAAKKM